MIYFLNQYCPGIQVYKKLFKYYYNPTFQILECSWEQYLSIIWNQMFLLQHISTNKILDYKTSVASN